MSYGGGDANTVRSFFGGTAQAVNLGGQGGKPVGFMAAQVGNTGKDAGRRRESDEGSNGRGQFTGLGQI